MLFEKNGQVNMYVTRQLLSANPFPGENQHGSIDVHPIFQTCIIELKFCTLNAEHTNILG